METTKNSDVRANNRKRIVNLLFHQGQMTKQELVRRLDLSLPTATLLLKELADKGLVTHGKVLDSTGGRKPVCIMPVYGAKCSLGAEVTAHGLYMVLLDLGTKIIAQEYYPCVMENTREYWTMVDGRIMDFAKTHISQEDMLLDIGVTLNVPMKDGHILRRKGEDVCMDLSLAAQCFCHPVKFRNSIKMEAIAQNWTVTREENFVFLSLGSQVSGAMIYEGNVLEFSSNNGQFGNMILGRCPKDSKVSGYFSTDALCERAGAANLEVLFSFIERNQPKAVLLWQEYLEGLSVLLHNLYCVFGWRIVVGGDMSPYLKDYKNELDRMVMSMDDFDREAKEYVEISVLGAYGAAVGAAMLPVDEFLEFGCLQ